METGEEKIQKICDALRRETLEPALNEAQRIIDQAKEQADQLIADAQQKVEKMLTDARMQVEQERNVFKSSLFQASQQGLETLRQAVQEQFFNPGLQQLLQEPLNNPKIMAELMNAIVKGIEKEGFKSDISLVVSKNIDPLAFNKFILNDVVQRLKEGPIAIGGFSGGVQVKLLDKKMTIDMSDEALKVLLSQFLRKDFRQMLFSL